MSSLTQTATGHQSTGTASALPVDDNFEKILQLAEAERRLRNSPQWKFDLEAAFDAHGEAVERLYDALYAALDARINDGEPVHPPRIPPDPRKELKKQIVARLKSELPGLVASVIDEF